MTINRPIADVFAFVADGGYRLESAGAISTQVTFWLREDLGGWKNLVFGGSVQKTMDAEMAALDRLKSVLEAG